MLFESIYESMEDNQKFIPREANVKLVMRHSVRQEITDPLRHETAMLTAEGIALARAFGRKLSCCIGEVYASPIARCMDTAQVICKSYDEWHSAKSPQPMASSVLYSCYIEDEQRMNEEIKVHGDKHILHGICGGTAVPGCTNLKAASDRLFDLIFAHNNSDCLDIFITHDFHLVILIASLFPRFAPAQSTQTHPVSDNPWVQWPHMLEGLLLWGTRNDFTAAWRRSLTRVSSEAAV